MANKKQFLIFTFGLVIGLATSIGFLAKSEIYWENVEVILANIRSVNNNLIKVNQVNSEMLSILNKINEKLYKVGKECKKK